MDNKDFDAWLASVPEVEPDEMDLAMMAQAEAEDDGTTMTLEEFREELAFTGRINVRMPKSLHKRLAANAKLEGVSLNQYVVYTLTQQTSHK